MTSHSPLVQTALKKMTEEQRLNFESEYNRRKASKGAMIALSILFPIQLILLGRVGLWWVYFLTAGGLSVWWIIEMFLTPKRVREYNDEVATDIVRDLKIIG